MVPSVTLKVEIARLHDGNEGEFERKIRGLRVEMSMLGPLGIEGNNIKDKKITT